ASVIAVGLVVSMIFTLVLVPVLYVVIERRHERRAAKRGEEHESFDAGVLLPQSVKIPAGIAAMSPVTATALVLGLGLALSMVPRRADAQTMRLTLDDAIALATKQGYATRLAAARVASAESHERGAAADLLPQLSVSGNHVRSSGRTTIVVPRG